MPRKGKKYRTHKVKAVEHGTSIIDYGGHAFPVLGSRSAVKKAIADGRLQINGRPAHQHDKVKKGDQLQLCGSGIQKAKKYDHALEVIYEDDLLIVINKPGGLAVNGNRKKTVENALAGTIHPSSRLDALPRPVAVHRIDVPTKGLVMLAKTKQALIDLSKAFEDNSVQKEYLAVVHGELPKEGVIDEPIQGKEAVTHFETVRMALSRVFKKLSLVKLQPVTGRTHQLRIHLQHKGHPIVGDKAYVKGRKTILGKGLFLCACKLQFDHPETGKTMTLKIKPPSRFHKLLEREEERFGR